METLRIFAVRLARDATRGVLAGVGALALFAALLVALYGLSWLVGSLVPVAHRLGVRGEEPDRALTGFAILFVLVWLGLAFGLLVLTFRRIRGAWDSAREEARRRSRGLPPR